MADTIVTPPPPKPVAPTKPFADFKELHGFFSKELLTYFTESYKHGYFIWQRTGGYETNSVIVLSSQTNSANSVDNSETTLLQYNIPANTLDSTGCYSETESFGDFASNGNTKQVNAYFGSNLLFSSSAAAVNGGHWNLQIKLIRVNSDSVKITFLFFCDKSEMPTSIGTKSVTIDLTTDQIFKVTGIGSATKDITQECLLVKMLHV